MIGLIFGETHFPKEILKKIKKKGINYLIIDLTGSFKSDRHSYAVSIGQFGKIIKILKENNCKKVLFAGKIKKPDFSKLRFWSHWHPLTHVPKSTVGDLPTV